MRLITFHIVEIVSSKLNNFFHSQLFKIKNVLIDHSDASRLEQEKLVYYLIAKQKPT
jgi:hypothetical protein